MPAAKDQDAEEALDELELVAHCLCQAQRFTARVPRSALPLDAVYCHCTSCRRMSGALYSTRVPWPGDEAAVRDSSLRRYPFSETIDILFCGVCGSTMFSAKKAVAADGSSSSPSYGVQTGVLTNINMPGLVRIADHIFLGDTLDGGASPWLCDANSDGSRPRLWRGRSGQGEALSSSITDYWPASDSRQTGSTSTAADDIHTHIPVRCHCGGVDLVLRQPIDDFAAQEERSALPWFVDPGSNKLLGGFDACDSCRLSSGSDLFHWTFVLLRHLAFANPSASSPASSDGHHHRPPPRFPASSVELKSAVATTTTSVAAADADRAPRPWGTLTFYESSPDVQRYFCSRCSATVFYAADDRPELLDLAIGLLHSRDGSRAESLISWDFGGKVGWRQDVVGGWREGFVENVEAAAERWRIKRGYPKNWRRIRKEKARV
ncbi:Mss4-like protein [Nemania sp. FL0031]|nr:Mss4-like protein [Nemania sp. FL0031]